MNPRKKRTKISCLECRQRKRKCDNNIKCRRCIFKNINCIRVKNKVIHHQDIIEEMKKTIENQNNELIKQRKEIYQLNKINLKQKKENINLKRDLDIGKFLLNLEINSLNYS
jgi:hypothetical protein